MANTVRSTLKGKNHYLIERGPGCEIINDVESVVTLTKPEVNELLGRLIDFSVRQEALAKVVKKLPPYYVKPNRDNIIFSLSGYLHKGRNSPRRNNRDLTTADRYYST